MKNLIKNLLKPVSIFYRFWLYPFRRKFGYIHETTEVDRPLYIAGAKNIYLHEGAHVPYYSMLLATHASITIKKYSGAAYGLVAVSGNHARIKGKFYRTITEAEKPAGYDKPIVVEEDVWMGANVTILSGVTVGRGCTVAAGAVITRSTPPYAVIGGVPAKVIKFYWTIDEILEHEENLYAPEERFSREYLEAVFEKYSK